jgi:alkylation response protein AidB-like acyl-CoA dehydrogenase
VKKGPGNRISVVSAVAAATGPPIARIFTIFEGTSEIQRLIICRAATGLDVR